MAPFLVVVAFENLAFASLTAEDNVPAGSVKLSSSSCGRAPLAGVFSVFGFGLWGFGLAWGVRISIQLYDLFPFFVRFWGYETYTKLM